jgi:hypothetical protein
MRWARFLLVLALATAGPIAVHMIWSAQSPRWLLALSGLVIVAVAMAWLILLALLYDFVVEKVRPSLRFRKPVVPLALSHREPTLVGHISQRNHPIRFWGGITLNNRFFVGFMLFDKPEYLRVRDRDASLAEDAKDPL